MSKTLCVPVAEGSVLDALLSAYATHKGRTNQAQVLRELALLGLASWHIQSTGGRQEYEHIVK